MQVVFLSQQLDGIFHTQIELFTDQLDPLNAEGKGYINWYKNGKVSTLIPADGSLSAPKGMLVKDGYLYVCDVNRIVVFSLKERTARPRIISLPEGNLFVNDLVEWNGSLYASVTNTDRIFRLDISDPMNPGAPQEWVTVPGPNGLLLDNGVLYVASYPADGNMRDHHVVYRIADLEHPRPEKLRMPDVLTRVDIQELTEEEWNTVRKAVEEALQHVVDFRKQEGAALEKKFTEKIDNIERLLKSIETYEKERVTKIRERITEALEKSLSIDYDKNRLEQELIYYIEKLDINEEKQRLSNHLKYFRETMAGGHGQGKKLGFIAQEMGREINTTGSKSNHAEMQNIVVQMKDELEQIKEQVLNVM